MPNQLLKFGVSATILYILLMFEMNINNIFWKDFANTTETTRYEKQKRKGKYTIYQSQVVEFPKIILRFLIYQSTISLIGIYSTFRIMMVDELFE